MTQKKFDCVAMKREAAQRIYEETGKLSLEEKQVYWQKKTDIFLKRQQARLLHRTQGQP